ncbi:SAM-dependent methyltransferase [Microtetraspora sp. NBRC 13810]|uniref:SAM-dependent methyltransferase n=1 Tax=Microtetraspora sp. NBRC 13810 TaxID=3030990 RepID=UPI0024A48C92|nr:SAM-dependent methyltransferase [Microtetraspora sp. NBRC 13810]GLW10758.1 SAM-dependent methyltransferase [Microtetraspora sp. NBRC 13810]
MSDQEKSPAWAIDPHVPSVARMYDYYLGGKDNFAADRAAADKVVAAMPYVRTFTRDNRALLSRVVTLLARNGVRQFLDIGSGLPTQENVHQVAQRAAPDSRVVYVDNDPIVLVHGRALLASNPLTTVVQADLCDPAGILRHPEVRAQIDFDRPVAVLLLAILHFVPDDEQAASIVADLRKGLVPGSYLAISHGHAGKVGEEVEAQVRGAYAKTTAGDIKPRTPGQVAAFLDGMELLEPGVVPVEAWRPPDDPVEPDFDKAGFLAAVGRVR